MITLTRHLLENSQPPGSYSVSDTSHLYKKCRKLQVSCEAAWPSCLDTGTGLVPVSLVPLGRHWSVCWADPTHEVHLPSGRVCYAFLPSLFLGTVEVINARETVPQGFHRDLFSGCSFPETGKETGLCALIVCGGGTKLRVGELGTLLFVWSPVQLPVFFLDWFLKNTKNEVHKIPV